MHQSTALFGALESRARLKSIEINNVYFYGFCESGVEVFICLCWSFFGVFCVVGRVMCIVYYVMMT